jgi:hypothetical protein
MGDGTETKQSKGGETEEWIEFGFHGYGLWGLLI